MSSIIELRKRELTGQVNQMVAGIEETIRAYSQYGRLKDDLDKAERAIERIKAVFEPQSDRPETFHRVIEELKELGEDAEEIRERGEAEKRRLQRNASSYEYAGTGSIIGAVLGGLVLGYGGCSSCMAHMQTGIPWFNTITGLLIGTIGGASMGALIGALWGQMSERESGDSASGLWLSIGGIVILILFGFWMSTLMTDDRQVGQARPVMPDFSDWQTSQSVVISECDTPCRMDVRYSQIIETGRKIVLVKFNGKKEWVRLDGDPNTPIPADKFNPGMAEFISPENAASVRVQILRKR
jgi:hypothetical protein